MILLLLYQIMKKIILKKEFKGNEPFIELSLDDSNLVGNIATLALGYPELNNKTKEELEEMLKDVDEFTKKLFILFIKLFNNSVYTGDKEEILICEKFSKFIENEDFINAVEDNYKKEELLKDTDPDKDKLLIESCTKIKKELYILSQANLECCKNEDDVVKTYLNDWNDNYEKYLKDLDEEFYIKIGKQKEHQVKKKFEELIEKLKVKRSKISNDFVKGLLDDMIDHLSNLPVYTEDAFAIAEIDVNKALADSEGYISSSSKTTFIHFPIIEYDDDLVPKGDFQEIYTLLMDFSDCNYLLNDLEKVEEKELL